MENFRMKPDGPLVGFCLIRVVLQDFLILIECFHVALFVDVVSGKFEIQQRFGELSARKKNAVDQEHERACHEGENGLPDCDDATDKQRNGESEQRDSCFEIARLRGPERQAEESQTNEPAENCPVDIAKHVPQDTGIHREEGAIFDVRSRMHPIFTFRREASLFPT